MHEYRIYRRLWVTSVLMLGLLIFVGGFRLYWGWRLHTRAASDLQAMKPEIERIRREARPYVRTETTGLANEQNQAYQLSDILEKWPRFTKYETLLIHMRWWQDNAENRALHPSNKRVKDPVVNEKAYVAQCMKLIAAMEEAAELPAFQLRVPGMSRTIFLEFPDLTELLKDLSWRLMKVPAVDQTARRQQLADLIRIMKLPPSYHDLCRAGSSSPFIIQSGNRWNYHKLLISRLGELSKQDWHDRALRDWTREMIHSFSDHEAVKANLQRAWIDQIHHLNSNKELLAYSNHSAGIFVLGDWLGKPLGKLLRGKTVANYFLATQAFVENSYVNDLSLGQGDKNTLKGYLDDELAVSFMPVLQLRFYHRLLAQREMLMTLLAIRLYESDKGSLPEKLDQLIPDYLDRLPMDYSVKGSSHIRYVPEKKLIYAAMGNDGENTEDDGGHPDDDLVVPLDGRTSEELYVDVENIDVSLWKDDLDE